MRHICDSTNVSCWDTLCSFHFHVVQKSVSIFCGNSFVRAPFCSSTQGKVSLDEFVAGELRDQDLNLILAVTFWLKWTIVGFHYIWGILARCPSSIQIVQNDLFRFIGIRFMLFIRLLFSFYDSIPARNQTCITLYICRKLILNVFSFSFFTWSFK